MTEKELCPTTGKVCYSQKEAAMKVTWFKRKNRKMWGFCKNIPTRYYQCGFCGSYHLTHFRKKRGK